MKRTVKRTVRICIVCFHRVLRLFTGIGRRFVPVEHQSHASARADQRAPGTDIVRSDTRACASRIAQQIEHARPRLDYLDAFRDDGRFVRSEKFAHAASHIFVDYLCAVLQCPESKRASDDMRRVEIMFFEAFKAGDSYACQSHFSKLPRSRRVAESAPRLIDNMFGAQHRFQLTGAVSAERSFNLLPGRAAVDKD